MWPGAHQGGGGVQQHGCTPLSVNHAMGAASKDFFPFPEAVKKTPIISSSLYSVAPPLPCLLPLLSLTEPGSVCSPDGGEEWLWNCPPPSLASSGDSSSKGMGRERKGKEHATEHREGVKKWGGKEDFYLFTALNL